MILDTRGGCPRCSGKCQLLRSCSTGGGTLPRPQERFHLLASRVPGQEARGSSRRRGSLVPTARSTVSAGPPGRPVSLPPPGRARTHLGALSRLQAARSSRAPSLAPLAASRPLKPGRLDACPRSPDSPDLRFSSTWFPGLAVLSPLPTAAAAAEVPETQPRGAGPGRGLAALGSLRK